VREEETASQKEDAEDERVDERGAAEGRRDAEGGPRSVRCGTRDVAPADDESSVRDFDTARYAPDQQGLRRSKIVVEVQ
jgi:hypothetical protein